VRIEVWGQNNFGPVYFGEHDAAPTPPTAQPEANTFRIYFPADGGGAPAKPYLSQSLRFVPSQSTGSNPPLIGETSRYAVSLTLTNPPGSIGPITLSDTRVVTANIPADPQLAYGGVAILSQGSVVSAPPLGASGNITWNAGILAPGDQEILTYYVDVSPTAAGDITVTGTVGSGDGTRAAWLDETGDEVNGTGLFAFGELCELAVTSAPATPVLVSSFTVRESGGDRVLEWRTAAEAGSVAFDLERRDASTGAATRLNRAPLAAQIGHPQGGVYRFVDRGGAAAGPSVTYRLIERESNGAVTPHGPFAAAAGAPLTGSEEAELEAGIGPANPDPFVRAPHAVQAFHTRRILRAEEERRALQAEEPRRPAAGGGGVEALRLEIDRTGLYRLDADALATGFGISRGEAVRLIQRGALRLTSGGREIGWFRGNRSVGLDFIGHAIDTPFTRRNVYRLSREPGTVLPFARGVLPLPPDWSDGSFRSTERFERATLGVTLLGLDPESDVWFWDFVMPGAQALKTLPAEIHDPAPGPDAELRLDLQGGAPGEHLVLVRVNGQEIDQIALSGTEAATAVLSVPASALADGDNAVEVESLDGGLVLIDGFDLDYERFLRPVDDRLIASARPGTLATVSPFEGSQVRVFDIEDPARPAVVASRTVRETDGLRVLWRARGNGPFLTVAASAARRPPVLEPDRASDLRDTAHEIDYLVITTSGLESAAQPLADLRRAQGLEARVIDVQDVYDEFADGLRDVRAIRSLLAYAAENWARAPSYVLIAAAGTYDHRDELGLGGSLISVLQGSRGSSLFAADAVLADPDLDGVMNVAIGRLPVMSAGELTEYVAKITGYEAGGDQHDRLVFLADRADGETAFTADTAALGDLVPEGYTSTFIDLDSQALGDARAALFAALEGEGSSWVHYSGHGGVDRLSGQGLLTSADVPTLGNAGRLPVLSSVSCHIGLHALPGFDSLGEFLVLEPNAGAAAVIAPTWLSDHSQARLLGDRLFRSVFQQRAGRLGDALRGALESAANAGAEPHLLRSYQILGDPALVLQPRPAPLEDDGPCTGPPEECAG
ncbi:MAG: C25 family cysteine peptidase, partial [Acidobacteriota bacterium]